MGLLCRADCIALTARITRTLSLARATGVCLFSMTALCRDRFLSILEQTRQQYRFVVVGYVVMPEHIHLLLSEPEVGTPSTVMQVLKQRTAHALYPNAGAATRASASYSQTKHSAEHSGRRASTTSTYGRRRSAWKS
jgi:REP element-mobilizing transposase RayT